MKEESEYITPNELADRWQCSRSSVDRYAKQANFKRLCLGNGRNSSIRYLRKEVLAYEKQRQV